MTRPVSLRPRRAARILARAVRSLRTPAIDISRGRPAGSPVPHDRSATTFEALEARTLLSSATFAGGVLTLTANSTGANQLVVTPAQGGAVFNAYANGSGVMVQASDLKSIVIQGSSGTDEIYIHPSAAVPATIKSGGGEDYIDFNGGAQRVFLAATGNGGLESYLNGADTGAFGPSSQLRFGDTVILGSGKSAASAAPSTPSASLPPPAQVSSSTGAGATSGSGTLAASQESATITGSNNGDSSAPTPVIQLMGKQVIVGNGVFVQALSSTLGAGTPLTAHYQWNFGDAGSQYNQLDGWNAGHVYDTPGTYTITLTLTNENGKTSTLTTQVDITADQRRTIYVDSVNGSDGNSGLAPDQAIRSVDRASALLGDDTRLLFHAGETFSVTNSIQVPYHDVLIGSYGSGAKPVMLRDYGTGSSTFSVNNSADQIVIQGLTFNSPYAVQGNTAEKIGLDGIYPNGMDNVIRNNTFLNVDDAINEARNPVGVLVQGNDAPLTTGLRGYFMWGQGTDQVVLGNTVANSTREHVFRSSGLDRVLVAYNDFTNADRSSVDPNDYSKGTIEIHKGTYAYVAHNVLHGGPLRVGPRGGSVEPSSTSTNWTVLEDNQTFDHEMEIQPGTHDLMIRDNIFHHDLGTDITVSPTDDQGRSISGITIANNTGISNGPGSQFITSYGGANGAMTLANNLWIAPNVTAGEHGFGPVTVYDTNTNVFGSISHNVWPLPSSRDDWAHGGINYVWPYWSNPSGYMTPQAWASQSNVQGDQYDQAQTNGSLAPVQGSIAATAGAALPGIYADFYGNARSLGGSISAGAVQS